MVILANGKTPYCVRMLTRVADNVYAVPIAC